MTKAQNDAGNRIWHVEFCPALRDGIWNFFRAFSGLVYSKYSGCHPERSEGSAVLLGLQPISEKADSSVRQKASALRMTISWEKWRITLILKMV